MKIFVYAMREFDERAYFDKFSEEMGCEYGYTTEYPHPDNVELARGYDAISATPCNLDAKMLDLFFEVGVKYIATRSIGVDHIDLKHAKELGMGVCRVSYAPETVADYTIMLMLMCCRNICHILERSKVQDYSLKGKMGRDICDCTVGVIGTGQIGSTVIKHLSSFGCKLLGYDLYENETCKDLVEYVPLEELYARSDIITLHTPATAENYHLLNQEAFSAMKNDVIIVNTARGSLIDTDALIDAIEGGKIGHAALDVLEHEDGLYYANRMGDSIPNRTMAILRSFPNVILSPHTAFYTEKVVRDMAYKCIKGVLDMMMCRMRTKPDNPLIVLAPNPLKRYEPFRYMEYDSALDEEPEGRRYDRVVDNRLGKFYVLNQDADLEKTVLALISESEKERADEKYNRLTSVFGFFDDWKTYLRIEDRQLRIYPEEKRKKVMELCREHKVDPTVLCGNRYYDYMTDKILYTDSYSGYGMVDCSEDVLVVNLNTTKPRKGLLHGILRFCPNCNCKKEISWEDDFCPYCGQALWEE